MAIYPYSFTLPPVNKQDIPSDGVVGEFLGISAGGVLDWLPVSGGGGSGDMLKADNLSGLADYAIARTNIGLGLTSSPEFANLTLTSPSLASSAPVTISQTWAGTGSTVFKALVVNATTPGTTSASGSLLLDLQVGGVSKFSVYKEGNILLPNATTIGNAATSIAIGTTNIYPTGSSGSITTLGTIGVPFLGAWFGPPSQSAFLTGDSLNTLALRNGANTQTFNVYGSYGSISDYKRLSISCDQTTGNATITNQAAGYTAGTVSINGVPVGLGKGNVATNVAIGSGALNANVTGVNNTIIGKDALLNSTAGTWNVIIGSSASKATLGVNNYTTVVGAQAMENCVTSSYNSAFGQGAGYFISTGGFLTSSQNSVFFGALSRPLGNGETNQIAIGFEAVGIGSNSVVLGNDSITKTALKGNVGIGTTAPTSRLHVQATGQTGVRENLLKCTVSDSGNDAFYMANATVADGSFVPGFIGAVFSSSARYCLNLAGQTIAANDTGTAPMVAFSTAITTDATDPNNGTLSAVGTRPLFTWVNFTTTHMQMSANGNLGIGTTSPTSKLHVMGDAVLTGQLLGSNYTVGTADSVTQANIAITNNHVGFADSAIVITPKGVGAFIVGPKPDGTATGGNARGNYAVDLQISKTANTQIAAGINSVITGGKLNTASGELSFVGGGNTNQAGSYLAAVGAGSGNNSNGYASYVGCGTSNTANGSWAFVGGGTNNVASADMAFVSGGRNASANRYALNAHSAGQFSQVGDAQKTTAVFRNKTTTNSAVELFLDGALQRYTITSGKIISMLINITGTKSDGSAVAHYVRQYSIKNIGGTTSQVYAAVTVGTDNAAGTSIAISADDTNDSLKIEVTGVAAETWRWVASVDAVEVGHGV